MTNATVEFEKWLSHSEDKRVKDFNAAPLQQVDFSNIGLDNTFDFTGAPLCLEQLLSIYMAGSGVVGWVMER